MLSRLTLFLTSSHELASNGRLIAESKVSWDSWEEHTLSSGCRLEPRTVISSRIFWNNVSRNWMDGEGQGYVGEEDWIEMDTIYYAQRTSTSCYIKIN